RISQLLNQRPDLRISPLRGNLDTRLKKLDSGDFDAIVVAAAGIRRLGWEERITEYLPITISLPAVGQGALCIECRKGDTAVLELINGMDHPETRLCVRAERAFLKRLEGGCQVPIGAYATIVQGVLEIEGLVASVDGGRMVREKKRASVDKPEEVGVSLAEILLAQGGEEILSAVYEAR
ncbi:MAG: hydroxymethylbilane synthase, partial [Nitrospirota bacterium]|nr:hydroxymethylbilane synthase [Nitrospirota bacterium]